MKGARFKLVPFDADRCQRRNGKHLVACTRADNPLARPTAAHRKDTCKLCDGEIWYNTNNDPFPDGAVRICADCAGSRTPQELGKLLD